jgi:FkbM family methyltransferase
MKTYIQIGANVGNDFFQKKMETIIDPSLIILVEPNSKLLEELKSNYKSLENKHKIIICNKAISNENKKTVLYIYETGDGHSSLIVRKSHNCVAERVEIEAITFNELCNIYKTKDVEMLFIDTEGLDYEIINSIDFYLCCLRLINHFPLYIILSFDC